MKRIPWSDAVGIAAILIGLFSAFAESQTNSRVIEHDPFTSITRRILPGDVNVRVLKTVPFPHVAQPPVPESFEQEIARISGYDSIARVSVSSLHGELTDEGTWIHTRVDGQASQLLKPGSLIPQNGFVEFWEDGGQTNVGMVSVTAEPHQVFEVGQSYLVFLRMDENRGTAYAAEAFHIDQNEKLQAIKSTDGSRPLANSTLVGKSVSEVATALSQPK